MYAYRPPASTRNAEVFERPKPRPQQEGQTSSGGDGGGGGWFSNLVSGLEDEFFSNPEPAQRPAGSRPQQQQRQLQPPAPAPKQAVTFDDTASTNVMSSKMIQDLFKSVQEDMSKDADLNASAQAQPASATSSVQSVQRQATQDYTGGGGGGRRKSTFAQIKPLTKTNTRPSTQPTVGSPQLWSAESNVNESVPEADNKVESNVQDSTEAELVSADNGNQAATSSTYSAPNSATDSTPASTDAPQPSLLVTTFKDDEIDHVSDDDEDETRFEKDVMNRRKSMGVTRLTGMMNDDDNADMDEDSTAKHTGLDLARRMTSVIDDKETMAGVMGADAHDVELSVAKTLVRIYMPNDTTAAFSVHDTIDTKELLRLAVEKHATYTGTPDPSLRLFVREPRRPDRQLYAGELPLVICSKICKELTQENVADAENQVHLVLAREKDKRPISVYLSESFKTKFLVPSNVTAHELTRFARIKWNRLAGLDEDDESKPLCVVMTAPYKNDRVLNDNDEPFSAMEKLMSNNSYLTEEKICFVIRVDERKLVKETISSQMLAQDYKPNVEDKEIYHFCLRSLVCTPEDTELGKSVVMDAIDEAHHKRRRSTWKTVKHLTVDDVNALHNTCVQRIQHISDEIGEVDLEALESYDINNEAVRLRVFRHALTAYTTDFLTRSAAKLVQMEDTEQSDFISIFDKTLRSSFASLHNSIDSRSTNKTLKEEDREVLKEYLTTFEEKQEEVAVDFKEEFRDLLTKALEKPKISLEEDDDTGDVDEIADEGDDSTEGWKEEEEIQEMDWGDDEFIFDWNSVTDGIKYSDSFNRSVALLQHSFHIPEDYHRDAVLREINYFNSNGRDAMDLLKMRLAVCVHNQHPFYNEFTTSPASYAKWQEIEKADVKTLLQYLLSNRKQYAKKLESVTSLQESLPPMWNQDMSPFKCDLTLDLKKASGLKSCSRPHVSVRIGALQLRSDTVLYDSVKEEAMWDSQKIKFSIDDPAQSLDLEISEESEGIDTSARRKIGILSIPLFELLPLDQESGEAVEFERWLDISPKGRILVKISANLHIVGMKKAGYADVSSEYIYSSGYHTRYMSVMEYGDRAAFHFFAPDAAMIRKLWQDNTQKARAQAKAKAEAEAAAKAEAEAETEAETETGSILSAPPSEATPEAAVTPRQSVEVGKSGTVEYESPSGKWEDVTLTIASNGITLVGAGYDENISLDSATITWVKKNRFKTGVIGIGEGDKLLKIRAKSRDSNNEWYDALVKAAEKRDAGDKDGSQQKEKVKRGKSFNFFKKDKDKKEDGLAVDSTLGKDNVTPSTASIAQDIVSPPKSEMSNRKKSMAVFAQIEEQSKTKVPFGDGLEQIIEQELAARHEKMGQVFTRGFFVEQTENDGIPELTLWTQEEKTIRLCWDNEDDSQEEFDEWKEALTQMSDRMRKHQFDVCTLEQIKNMNFLLEKYLEEDDWPYVFFTRLHEYFLERIKELEAKDTTVALTETTEHAEETATELTVPKSDIVNYHGHFRQIIYAMDQATLTPTGGWLMDKYGLMYGVQRIYRQLIFLDYLARKFSKEMGDTTGQRTSTYLEVLIDIFEFLSSQSINVEDGEIVFANGIALTVFEKAILEDSFDLLESLESDMVGAYKDNFPYGKGGLADALKLFKLIITLKQKFGLHLAKTNDESTLSPEDHISKDANPDEAFAQILAFFIQRGCKARYEAKRETFMDQNKKKNKGITADIVCKLADGVLEELQADEDYFSKAFGGYFNLLEITMAVYVKQLALDVSRCVASGGVDEFSMFKIYFRLKKLYDAYDDVRPRSLGVLMNSFDPLVLAWIRNVKRQTLKWTQRALVQDKLVPESEKNLHSSSVVDLFCCLNDSHDFLVKLDWKDPAARVTFNLQYADLLASAIQSYTYDLIGKLKREYMPVDAGTSILGSTQYADKLWNQHFFITLNNVDMALAQSRKMYEDMKDDIDKQLEIIQQRKEEGTWTQVKPKEREGENAPATAQPQAQAQPSNPPPSNLRPQQSNFRSMGLAAHAASRLVNKHSSRASLNPHLMRSGAVRRQPSQINIPTGAPPTQNVDPSKLAYYDGGPATGSDWLEHFRTAYQRPRRMKDVLVGTLLRSMQPQLNNGLYALFGGAKRDSRTSMRSMAEDCDVSEEEVERMLNSTMEYLDGRLAILNTNLYQSVFGHVLRALWAMICKSVGDIVSPPPEGASMKWTLGRALTPREYIICSQALQILVDFFNADGDGLDMSVLKESEYRQCMGVLAQCSATTQELIRDYQRQIATTEERTRVLNALRARHNDQVAKQFCKMIAESDPSQRKSSGGEDWADKISNFFG